ncbi:hypothetical protein S225a_27870 [Candidatus Brocadiaceae bacterium S225]|nr:hypothetical protein S225a_27870 [Candidatus Brocadiaceae bacterium S225]
MHRLNKIQKILKTYKLQVVNTKKGKHPFKVKGIILGTTRHHTYPLKVHGKNPEISKSYLNGIIEEFNLPGNAFTT